ncbi:dihydrofolate reductase family protein [Psychromicrobium xiongbiense]|uniref:dihydrofolate reductase family protein n=1 Tax=Psychromicrobium xiongbiense TaxID=3051184 RepID=UPI002553E47E|nr:dihydrofolate reductase family protein [Psychromicrobium sp. YIM S02556]
MSRITAHLSMSLDGFISGPDQSLDNPVGVGGMQLLHWHSSQHAADAAALDELLSPMGAFIMGRNMFGPIRGPWTGDWRGWWGDEPPYHSPVFVLTRYAQDPIEMAGGTTFHFVTGGFDAALAQARETADGRDIRITGGASTVRQALAAGVLNELYLDIIPVALGHGESIFDGPASARFTPLDAAASPVSTHIHYRVS